MLWQYVGAHGDCAITHVALLDGRGGGGPSMLISASTDSRVCFWQLQAASLSDGPLELLKTFHFSSSPSPLTCMAVGTWQAGASVCTCDLQGNIRIYSVGAEIGLARSFSLPTIFADDEQREEGEEITAECMAFDGDVLKVALRDRAVVLSIPLAPLLRLGEEWRRDLELIKVPSPVVAFVAGQMLSGDFVFAGSSLLAGSKFESVAGVVAACMLADRLCVLSDALQMFVFRLKSQQWKLQRVLNLASDSDGGAEELEEEDFKSSAYLNFNNLVPHADGRSLYVATGRGVMLVDVADCSMHVVIGKGSLPRPVQVACVDLGPSQAELADLILANPAATPERPFIAFTQLRSNVLCAFVGHDAGDSDESTLVKIDNPLPALHRDANTAEKAIGWRQWRFATLRTLLGDVVIELLPQAAPKAVENFVGLAQRHYYDLCTWHRTIPGFICQTGDPSGTGKGGESIWRRGFDTEPSPAVKFDRAGRVAMANTGRPMTNHSQFFITVGQQCPWLDGKFSIFGQVVRGLELCADIAGRPTQPLKDRPVEPVQLLTVELHAVLPAAS